MESYNRASTGLRGLDRIMDGLRLGDNVVWQVDAVDDYRRMVAPYVAQARSEQRAIVYVRFAGAEHEPLVTAAPDIEVHELDPSDGFEQFATTVHHLIASKGTLAFYVFDPLTDLLDVWHSDLMVMNFFKVTCPFLYELDTIAYFAMLRNEHTATMVAGIRETTQLLLDLYFIADETYVHPLKVWGRHSPTMFFPHRVTADEAESITSSAASASLFASQSRTLARRDHWHELIDRGYDALQAGGERERAAKELMIAVLIGRSGRMVELCRRHLSLADLLAIAGREIGSGYIGGKSVGMLVARAVLEADEQGGFAERLEPHDSYYLGSDLFYTYIIFNGWWKLLTEQRTEAGYFDAGAELRVRLAEGHFPPGIREQLLPMLEYFGQSPIIVRSSSLLEDNFGNAFAGKYESVFCAGQGTPEERLRAFEDAVRTVYASAMSEEALEYRRKRGLDELDEQMAILVQRVSGDHHGEAFFPHAAGVGNSSNLYVWDPDIDMDAGMLRLVFGLGTRAVDRTVQDYARIVALDEPLRGRLSDRADLSRFSQRHVDVISLPANELATVTLPEVTDLDIKADWSLFLSPDEDVLERMRERGRALDRVPRILDFRRLLGETTFAPMMREVLRVLSAAYEYPVDIEFTLNMTGGTEFRVGIVQCRPLQTHGLGRAVAMPVLDDPDDCLLASAGDFMGGNVRLPLEYALLVRPEAYLGLGQSERHAVARAIGQLNRALEGSAFMLLGPGRWGTTTPSLGVPVRFAEIANASVLAELTYAAGDFRPELSYGSHFFQDLVESQIFYIGVFDERPDVRFHPERILERENQLARLVPEAAGLASIVHVARFERLELYSDVVSQRVVCC